MKNATLYTGGMMVLLALAGCSGEPEGESPPASTAPATSTASVSESATAPDEPTEATPSSSADDEPPAATGSQLTADELEAVLTAVNEAESLNAQVIPDEQVRPLLEEGAGALEDLVVRPEECNAFAESNLPELTEEAVFAVMTFAGESSLQPDTVSLSSVPSAETIAEQIAASRAELAACSEFELDIGGEAISATVEELEVQTDAEQAIAVQTTVQVPGSIQESVSVTGVLGGTSINVVVGSSGDPQADVQRAAGLINAVVVELGAL